MKYYAVIDTNVVVSAMLKFDSVPGTVLRLALDGLIVPLLNEEIIAEYRTVLERPKFHLTREIICNIIENIAERGIFIDEQPLEISFPDPKDRVFFEVVMEAKKENDAYLITGNIKHFPVKPFVVTPREMLDVILNDKKN